MKKALIQSTDELIKLLEDYFDSVEAFQEFLGVEFAFADGKFESEIQDYEDFDDDQDVDFSNYKVLDTEFLPKSYPCVVVYAIEHSFDRCGDVGVELIDYVYPRDFVKKVN